MSIEHQLAILDGTVLPGCPHCGVKLPEMEAQKVYIDGLEKSLRAQKARNALIVNEQMGTSKSHPLYPDAFVVYEHWKALLSPMSRAFTEIARKAVFARLKEGRSVDELKTAVTGYAGRPYIVDRKRSKTGKRSERFVKLDLILRDDDRVAYGIELFQEDREERIKQSMPQDVITPETLGHGELPPMDLDAEVAVLGSVLFAGEHAGVVVRRLRDDEGLTADRFYRPLFAQIYQVMCDMEVAGETIDEVTLASKIEADDGRERIVYSLRYQTPNAANYRHYAQLVLKAWGFRAQLNVGREMIEAALGQDPEKMDKLVQGLLEVRQGVSHGAA